MAFLKSVESNTSPAYNITCDRPDGSIIDLTGTTVTMKLFRNGTQVNTTAGHDACTLVTATSGIMSWQPKTGDLASGAGTYFGDVKVTNADSTFEILYGKFKLKTRNKIG